MVRALFYSVSDHLGGTENKTKTERKRERDENETNTKTERTRKLIENETTAKRQRNVNEEGAKTEQIQTKTIRKRKQSEN